MRGKDWDSLMGLCTTQEQKATVRRIWMEELDREVNPPYMMDATAYDKRISEYEEEKRKMFGDCMAGGLAEAMTGRNEILDDLRKALPDCTIQG